MLGSWVDHACSNRHCPSIMTTITALTDHTIMSLQHTHTHYHQFPARTNYIQSTPTSSESTLTHSSIGSALSFMTSSEHSTYVPHVIQIQVHMPCNTGPLFKVHIVSRLSNAVVFHNVSFLLFANNDGRCLGPARRHCSQ